MPDTLAATWPHYFSTYCIHGQHGDCRLTCKVCGAACRCDCHTAIPPAERTDDA